MTKFNRPNHATTTFFVGSEICQTPAFGKKTLFVVGFQDTSVIEKYATEHKVQHIFLGANHSFDASHHTAHFGKTWDDQITKLLGSGLTVTLDYAAHQHDVVLESLNPNVWTSRNFIPLLSVRIPHVETSSMNLTIKIDDTEFGGTNPGVWCMNVAHVTDSNKFTGWVDHDSDTVIGLPEPVVEQVLVPTMLAKTAEVDIVEITPVALNEVDTGLVLEPAPSILKADPEVPAVATVAEVATIKTPEAAANAYADGATVDPLGKTASVKVTPKGKK